MRKRCEKLRNDFIKALNDLLESRMYNDDILNKSALTRIEELSINTIKLLQDVDHYLDNDTYGIKNVNFTCIDKEDHRWDEFKKQRNIRGYDESELWNLDHTIASFILPRLRDFSNNIIGIPCDLTESEWSDILKSMVRAFELYTDEEIGGIFNDKQHEEVEKGFDNFRKYFYNLWN